MNKKKSLLALLSSSVVACAPTKDGPPIDANCPGGPKNGATVTLVPSGAAKVDVAPPVVCVLPGTEVTFRVTPANRNATIATTPKVLDDGWMFGVKAPGVTEFSVAASGTPREEPYYYNVFWQGKEPLDPRVTIRTDR